MTIMNKIFNFFSKIGISEQKYYFFPSWRQLPGLPYNEANVMLLEGKTANRWLPF